MPDSTRIKQIFVGREKELSQVDTCFHTVIQSKRPRFILVQGDYGVGKTALIEHFMAKAKSDVPNLMIGRGKCSMETEANGLAPFGQIFNELAKQGVQWKVIGESLWEFTKKVAPAWLDIATAGFLGAAAGAAVVTAEELGKLVPAKKTQFSIDNVFIQFTNALSEITCKNPCVIFVDDLQWADHSSLELLFYLANNLEDRAILFIGSYRPVEAMETSPNADVFRKVRANLVGRVNGSEIILKQGIDVKDYIQSRYYPNSFAIEVIEHVQEQTEGHPLYISQLFSWWEETGTVISEPGFHGENVYCFMGDLDKTAELPPNVGAILDERIRLLNEQLKTILLRASVEGEDFTAQTIINLLKIDEFQIYEDMQRLEHNYQLIQEQTSETIGVAVFDFYRFAHRFFREHIYGNLSSGQRRILHKQVGECLENLYEDRRAIAGQLVKHFSEALQWNKAAQYVVMAAEYEYEHYAWHEGRAWCHTGLGILEHLTVEEDRNQLHFALMEKLAHGWYCFGDYVAAEKYYKNALEIGQTLFGNESRNAEICAWIADALDEQNKYDEAMEIIKLGKQILVDSELATSEVQMRLENMESLINCRFGNYTVAIELISTALEIAQKNDISLNAISNLYGTLGIAYSYLEQYADSIPAFQHAIKIAKLTDDSITVATSLANLADDLTWLGHIEKSVTTATESIDIARQVGSVDTEAYAIRIRGRAYLFLREYDKAVSDLERAIILFNKSNSGWGEVYAYSDLALTHLQLDDLKTAYQYAQKGLTIAGDEKRFRAYSMYTLGRVEGMRENWEQAFGYFEEALQTYREVNQNLAWVQRNYGIALLRKGDLAKALDMLQSALENFKKIDLANDTQKTANLINSLLANKVDLQLTEFFI